MNYNISNGFGTQAQLFQEGSMFDDAHDARQKQKYQLLYILRDRKSINSDLLPNLLCNYANLLDQLGRTVEAIDYYHECLTIAPDHAIAMGNYGCALRRLVNISTAHNSKLIHKSWKLIEKAIQLEDKVIELGGYHVLLYFVEQRNKLEEYILNYFSGGVEELENSIVEFDRIHTQWKPNSARKKIQTDNLLLSI